MKKQKKIKKSRQNKIQSRLIVMIVLIVFVAVGVNTYQTYLKYQELIAKEAEVDMAITEAETERAILDDREDYMQTDDYVRDVAKEEFGMIEKDEYLLKSNTEE